MSDEEEFPVPIVRLPGSGLGGQEVRGGPRRKRTQNRVHSNELSLPPDQSAGHRGMGRGRGEGRSRGRGRGQGHNQGNGRDSSLQSRSDRGSRGGPRGRSRRGGSQDGMRRWQSTEVLGATSASERNDKGPQREYVERAMGYKKLSDLAAKENNEDIALEITSSRSGFGKLLNCDDIRRDLMCLLLQVVEKACRSAHRESVMHILSSVCASPFIEKHVMNFLTGALFPPFKADMAEKLNQILIIFSHIHQRLPSSAERCVGGLIVMKTVIDTQQLSLSQPEIEQRRAELVELCQKAALVVKEETSHTQQRRRRREAVNNADDDAPPDNFRETGLFPDIEDLHLGKDVFLRKNKDEGAYADLNTYLDVQFRLLREDYIQPLRKGIQEYRNCLRKGETPKKLSDLRLYYDVQIIGSVCNEDVETRLKFDTTNTSKIRWQSSKRLIYGSLVGLSQDDFETIIFATVTNRNVSDLERGIIQVRFESSSDVILRSTANDSFIMAETTAYFEAYKHVLYRLQQIDDGMPFQKYIVHCKTQVGPPKYFFERNKTHYNLRALGDASELRAVPVLTTVNWPDPSKFNLDSSQLDAVKTALTKEVAIIQGPPGTGKTYVGLKIVQTLFENRDAWAGEETKNAVLVVCYTNHALDQFLEGIAKFLERGIVRVGGRSSSEEMKKFNLKELRMQVRKEKKVRRSVMGNSLDCKKTMSSLRRDIEEVSSRVEASSVGILHERVLQQFMDVRHYESLVRKRKQNPKDAAMQVWLGFEDTSEKSEEDQAKQVLTDHWIKIILKSIKHGGPQRWEKQIDEDKILSLGLVKRVRLYQGWIIQFRSHIRKKISEAEDEYVSDDSEVEETENPQLQGLKFQLHSSYNEILSDVYLRPFVPQNIFRAITSGKYSQFQSDLAIQAWLGASPSLIEEGLPQAMQELEADIDDEFLTADDDELTDVDEEADIITAQRFVDDQDNIFQTKSGSSAFLLSKAMEAVTFSLTSFDSESKSGKKKKSGEWEVQTQQKKKLIKKLQKILRSKECMSEEDVRYVGNVWDVDRPQRISLYKHWVLKYQSHLRESIQGKEQEYRTTASRLKEVLLEEDRDILDDAMVIGMTTTGAAKHAALLQIVAPRIIIVEEAAEVLESHIITTLNPKCQHLILIGDHQQLRPNPTVYDLAKTYNLDISLFERLIKNEMHHVTLSLQHRMRPEISILMKHIYPNLMDHESVLGYPKALGVEKNIFFVHHEHHEQHQDETKSRTNEHEASYIVALCRYFLLQGYKPSEITILAAYTGQILLIKRRMTQLTHLFKGVRLTSVDNYQGEENKIILLSLVRSNEEGSVGFLGIENRVCVALSRAKEGLFAIGNFKLLAQKSTLWTNIVETLKEKQNIGLALRLQCQNHPDMTIDASKSTDFDKAPEGGCIKPCDLRLPCGHVCERVCHNVDRDHKGFKCQKPCRRPRSDCLHACPKKCSEKCSNCQELVSKTIPMCGHTDNVPCFKDPHAWDCTQTCQGTLMCGHKCRGKCGACRKGGHRELCKEIVEKIWPCGHVLETNCHKSTLVMKCTEPCIQVLDCGHKCKGSCGECMYGRIHKSCPKKCKRKLPCSHVCQQACGAECLPCTLQCTTKCSHSTCRERCGQVCQPCKELCLGGCSHTTCTKICSEMCNSEMCNVPCNKTLFRCGHKCIGVCGESCLCKECNAGGLKSSRSLPSDEEETFIMLKACGHIFSRDYLDIWMKSVKYATMPVCPEPKCQKMITESVRYANVVRKAFQEIQDLKRDFWTTTQKLGGRVLKLKQSMSTSSLPMETIRLLADVLARNPTSINTVKTVENQFSMALDIYNVQTAVSSSFLGGSDLAKELDALQKHLLQKMEFMSDQMIREYKAEIKRLVDRMKSELMAGSQQISGDGTPV